MAGIHVLPQSSYPELLLEMSDPPKKLYIRGTMPPQEYKYLTVIGSRKYSQYGKEVCQKLIAGLDGFPIVIVSGLAIGIDGIAHRAALDARLHTLAVPGSGLSDKALHPKTNFQLARDILAAGGALLSEFEPETPPALWTFPQRNRIMAGLSHATLLIEAGEKSGTLITARLASDYNRELLVVPGSIFSPNSRGNHQFLKLGATPVTEARDILDALGFVSENKNNQLRLQDFSGDERKVFELLSVEPLSRDELIERLGMNVHEANSLFIKMELKNMLQESAGKIHLTYT